ncbi:MAG: DUF624 domain-containing protein [Lachnospiraceae bacterium]|nr:DUF624 domain-containing protein [Lachnospiraceae bacterium]
MSNYGTFGENNPVWKAVNRISDMLFMGLLFLITCLPVITIGASLSAFYYAAMDSMRKEDGYIFKRYFGAFGRNFKKATGIWLILLVLAGICGVNYYCWTTYSELAFAPVMLGLTVVMSIMWLMTFIFAFPLQARFENTIRKTIENAFLLALSHLPFTFVLIVLIAIIVAVFYFSWMIALLLVVLGTGILGYMIVHYFEVNFKKWGYIAEDDGKIKDDDYEFQVELDYDALYGDQDNELKDNTADKEDTIDE